MGHRKHLRLAPGPRSRPIRGRRETLGEKRTTAPGELHRRDREGVEPQKPSSPQKAAASPD